MKKQIAILLLAALCLALTACGASSTPAQTPPALQPGTVSAKMNDDGTAYLPLMDGTVVKINEEVSSATLAADRKTVVVLLEDGTLYYTDPARSEKHVVADDADSFKNVRDAGFFYTDTNDRTYRVTFADGASVELGKNIVMTAADSTLSALYATDDGKIFALPYDSEEGERAGSFASSVYVEAISDDGATAVWVTKDDTEQTLILSENGDRTTLGTVTSSYDHTYAVFSADQRLVVVGNTYSDQIYLKKPGEDTVKVKLGNALASSTFYTANGPLNQNTAESVEGLYFLVEADSGYNVYYVSLDGERERVLSKISDFETANGYAVYETAEGGLYCAALNGAELGEEKKISGETDYFTVSETGGYVYYLKNGDGSSGTLYCYRFGEEGAKKVASDVGYWSYYTVVFPYYSFGSNGDTVYYLKGIETCGNGWADMGTLYKWSYAAEESTKIASDVYEWSMNSGLRGDAVLDSGFMLSRYNSYDSYEDDTIVDWYWYNGEGIERLASEVIN